jgi:hypothetical protein
LERPRRGILDIVLLIGSALLLTAVGVGLELLRRKYGFGLFWISAPPLGAIFFVYVVREIRSRLATRPSALFLSLRFVIHMVVTLLAAAYLRLIPATLTIGFEMWIGGTIAFRLCRYRVPSNDKK